MIKDNKENLLNKKVKRDSHHKNINKKDKKINTNSTNTEENKNTSALLGNLTQIEILYKKAKSLYEARVRILFIYFI
jgi:hypothetical protein